MFHIYLHFDYFRAELDPECHAIGLGVENDKIALSWLFRVWGFRSRFSIPFDIFSRVYLQLFHMFEISLLNDMASSSF